MQTDASAVGDANDTSGNMLNDGAHAYAYNAESEIKSAAGVNYTYDGDGNRVEKSSGKIYWYGAGTEILGESDTSGNITNEYVFFGGKRIAMRNVPSGTIYYYEDDMLGSSRTMVQAGQTSPCYDGDFYPFGGERIITNTCSQNYKFEGKERDTETGNDDFGARYYSSRLGRWLSADWSSVPAPVPYANLTNPQTLNLYAMVSDNPETFADLDGHSCGISLNGDADISCSNVFALPGEGFPPPQNNGTGTPNSTTQQAQQQSDQQNQAQEQLKFKTVLRGHDTWKIRWGLTHTSKKGGWIVQHMEINVPGHGKQKGRTYNYWEAWKVPAGSRFTTRHGYSPYDDMLRGSSGTTFYGQARFYQGLALPSSFTSNNPATAAGVLPATTVNPNLPLVNATAANRRWWEAQ